MAATEAPKRTVKTSHNSVLEKALRFRSGLRKRFCFADEWLRRHRKRFCCAVVEASEKLGVCRTDDSTASDALVVEQPDILDSEQENVISLQCLCRMESAAWYMRLC